MSDYSPKLNSGNLHPNKYKEKENQPDYRGKINISGKVMDISGWLNKNKNGEKYMSVQIQDEYVKQDAPAIKTDSDNPSMEKLDDEIPF
jgi:uncharacterized protein (DUF736 family)